MGQRDAHRTSPLRIGLITCADLPEPDHDEAPALAAFDAAGHHAEPVAWDAGDVGDLAQFNACLLRATWNYYEDADRFLKWVDAAADRTLLLNPPGVVRWNLHKRYLLELAEAGLPIIPTVVASRGSRVDLARLAAERGWHGGVMVKPAIGAGSWNARRFAPEDLPAAQAFVHALCATMDVIVQPLAPGFAEPGERSLMWIGGAWTHAIRKRPRYAGEDESVVSDGPATAAERALGDRALACAPGDLTYARLDVIEGDPHTGARGSTLLISELELIEPSLFLFCEGGAEASMALVRATERAVGRVGASRGQV